MYRVRGEAPCEPRVHLPRRPSSPPPLHAFVAPLPRIWVCDSGYFSTLPRPASTCSALLPRRPLGPYRLRFLRVFCTRGLHKKHKRRSQDISQRMLIQIAKPEPRSIRGRRGWTRVTSQEKGVKKSPVQRFELRGLERRPRAQKKGRAKHKTHVYAVTLIDLLLTMDIHVGEAPMPYLRPHENHGEHGKT